MDFQLATATYPFGLFTLKFPEDTYINGTVYSIKISDFTTSQPDVDADYITWINSHTFTDVNITNDTGTLQPRRVNPPGIHDINIEYASPGFPSAPTGTPSSFTVTMDVFRVLCSIELTYMDTDIVN